MLLTTQKNLIFITVLLYFCLFFSQGCFSIIQCVAERFSILHYIYIFLYLYNVFKKNSLYQYVVERFSIF